MNDTVYSKLDENLERLKLKTNAPSFKRSE
jgi:hypothetical protein